MPRDTRAYLADIVESCAAITRAVSDISLAEYRSNRLIRSSVEREFILIGEAMAALARVFTGNLWRHYQGPSDRRLPQSTNTRIRHRRRCNRVGDRGDGRSYAGARVCGLSESARFGAKLRISTRGGLVRKS